MVAVAKLVKAADCGSAIREFESHRSPLKNHNSCVTKKEVNHEDRDIGNPF